VKQGGEGRAHEPPQRRAAHVERAQAAPTRAEPAAVGLSASRVLALQRAAGNRAVSGLAPLLVQRDPPDGAATTPAPALPKIDHLPAMTQTLLEGVLAQKTIDAAVRKIYDNMFQKTGWKYTATESNISRPSYVRGVKTAGMCESYRNAFAEILSIYDGLRPGHPEPAIRDGALRKELGNDLSQHRFVTRRGLTLMGATALKGNVFLQVDGSGNVLAQGLDAVNLFIFKGHWTLKVNGVEYDPIFHSIGENNVGKLLDETYSDGTQQFFHDTSKPIPTNEFGATFIHVTDIAGFRALLTKIEKLDADLAGAGMFTKAGVKKKVKAFFKTIPDRAVLTQLVATGYNADRIPKKQRDAFNRLNAAFPATALSD
jgi:hypothetical protein